MKIFESFRVIVGGVGILTLYEGAAIPFSLFHDSENTVYIFDKSRVPINLFRNNTIFRSIAQRTSDINKWKFLEISSKRSIVKIKGSSNTN